MASHPPPDDPTIYVGDGIDPGRWWEGNQENTNIFIHCCDDIEAELQVGCIRHREFFSRPPLPQRSRCAYSQSEEVPRLSFLVQRRLKTNSTNARNFNAANCVDSGAGETIPEAAPPPQTPLEAVGDTAAATAGAVIWFGKEVWTGAGHLWNTFQWMNQ